MNIVRIDNHNRQVYLNLVQAYEAEFSLITGKKPDGKGIFAPDTEVNESNLGFLLYLENIPAGLSVVTVHGDKKFAVSEFYVLPCFRKRKLGKAFAHKIWDEFRGHWEIKQIQGAEYATRFWRKVVEDYAGCQYKEDVYEDSYWGVVTRQRFINE